MGTHRLRNRAEVLIRPVAPGDRDTLATAFGRPSDASRHSRFLEPTTWLTEPMLDHLTRVDHHEHGTVELEAELPPEGLFPELRAALRLAAGS